MLLYEPIKELKTSYYLPLHQVMLQSSHWINPVNGERVKLSAGLKLYYEYRLQRSYYFTSLDLPYSETNLSCSKALSIGCSTITNSFNPLLKSMGLLEAIRLNQGEDERYFHFDVKSINEVKGWLINPYFLECKRESKVFNKDKIDYKQLKTLEHNKLLADSIRYNKSNKVYLISEKDRREYLQLKQELIKLDD